MGAKKDEKGAFAFAWNLEHMQKHKGGARRSVNLNLRCDIDMFAGIYSLYAPLPHFPQAIATYTCAVCALQVRP